MSINVNAYPKCFLIHAAGGSTYNGANLTTFNVPCYSLTVENLSSGSVNIKLNSDSGAVFICPGNSSIGFANEFIVSSVDVDNSGSGASQVNIQLIAALSSK